MKTIANKSGSGNKSLAPTRKLKKITKIWPGMKEPTRGLPSKKTIRKSKASPPCKMSNANHSSSMVESKRVILINLAKCKK